MRRINEQLDQEYKILNNQLYQGNWETNQDELDKLRKRNEQNIMKGGTNRKVERLFNEIYYQTENELRIKKEIEQIKGQISNLEMSLMSAKEIKQKSELVDLLSERDSLAILETQLLNEVIKFKDNLEKNSNHTFESVIDDLFLRKEQIDSERLRLTKNLERILKGDFKNIQREKSNLLREQHSNGMKFQALSFQKNELDYFKTIIKQGAEKIQSLRVIFSKLKLDIQRKVEKNF